MTDPPERPDVRVELARLKDFQRRTVDYAFRRMFKGRRPAHRFLVADEVGLGKTLVARGLIVRAVDLLWDSTSRIDVVYVCSNMDIARQNRSRLSFGGNIPELPDRITLLPITAKNLGQHKFSFMAITPGTSLDPRSSGGRADERVLLYHLLKPARAWGLGNRVGPRRALQGDVGWERWNNYLDRFRPSTIDRGLWDQFLAALDAHDKSLAAAGNATLRERFDRLSGSLAHRDNWLPQYIRDDRNQVVGELREVLARTCLRALDPDLIILDEFQRFRELLVQDGETPLNRLAGDLFAFTDADGSRVRVLLLSATPYKPYTGYGEEGDDHYRDFLQTVAFLQNDPAATKRLQVDLRLYREALLKLAPALVAENGDGEPTVDADLSKSAIVAETLDELRTAKAGVEAALRRVMVRTERTRVGASGDAMLTEVAEPHLRLDPADLRDWLAVTRLSEHLGVSPPVDYWKSAPYLASLLDSDHYDLKRRLTDVALATMPSHIGHDRDGAGAGLYLDPAAVEGYRPVEPSNGRLRALLADTVDREAWRLLWLPPTLPYYDPPPGSPYADPALRSFTKSLVFSCWHVVPKAIATLVSYEAERRMVEQLPGRVGYGLLLRERRPLLRFTESGDRLTGMPVFLLLYPSATLATIVDPVTIRRDLVTDGQTPSMEDVVQVAEWQVRRALQPILGRRRRSTGAVDEAWYWSALAQLDGLKPSANPMAWLRSRDDATRWTAMVQVRSDAEDGNFGKHVDRFTDHVAAGEATTVPEALGAVPEETTMLLAQVALASPAVCALRALQRLWPDVDVAGLPEGRAAAARIAMGFRSLFNLPESISLLRGTEDERSLPYWRMVLDYCLAGNLQAVLDEYVHVLCEHLGLFNTPVKKALAEIGAAAASAVALRTVRLTYDALVDGPAGRQIETARLRARFAMRFGDDAAESGEGSTRADQVRAAFNSPFRPFVLATTSIGQEGLDFHLYCHRVVHWNLPSNPVDLEQREGRVHRYKGHAIRRNVAAAHADAAFDRTHRPRKPTDPWSAMFDAARRREKRVVATELDPYWIYEQPNGACIERIVPLLPLSREIHQLERLKRELAIYRLAFGQPRQQDLLEFLAKHVDPDTLRTIVAECTIDLSPK